jgi:hypothetical protein
MSAHSRPFAAKPAHLLLTEWLELSPAVPEAPSRALVVGTLADADTVTRRFPAAGVTGSPVVPATGVGRYEFVVAAGCLPDGPGARSALARVASVLAPGGTLLLLAPATAAEHLGVLGAAGLVPVAFDDLTGVPGDRSGATGNVGPGRWLRITYRHAAPAGD